MKRYLVLCALFFGFTAADRLTPVVVWPDGSEPVAQQITVAARQPLICIDINTASVEDLQLILHMGELRAEELVRLRPYGSVEQLGRISGIGPTRLSGILQQGLVCDLAKRP